jgi:hypothetical protein
MRKIKRALQLGCLLALGCCGALAVPPAQADVLDQMPADAALVIKLNHIAETNTRLGTIMQQLGVTDLMPALKDPLQTLEDSAALGAGLDTKRDAGAFFTAENLANGMQGGMAGVALFPVSDYKAFLGSGDVVRTENETTVMHFKGREDDLFVQQWGDYAAIASSKESLSVKHDGLKPSATAAKELANDDIVFFANFAPLKGKWLPKLDDGAGQLTDLIDKQLTDPAQKEAADAAVKQLIQAAREFLNDAQGSAIGITINDKGIKGSLTVDFAPDTYLGKLATTLKQSNGPLLAGLPGAPTDYLAFGGFVQDPAWAGGLFDDMVNPVAAKLPGMGDDGKKILDILATAKGAVATAEGGVFGAVAPTGQLGQGSMLQEVFVMKGDSTKIKSAQAKAMELTGTMMSTVMQMMPEMMQGRRGGNANANTGGDLFKTITTAGYKTIGGVSLDRLQVQVNPDNTSPQAMQMSETLSMMYGPDGIDTVAGTIDAKTFFGAVGAPEQLITDAIEATKANKDVLSGAVKDIDAELPKNRAVAEYFGLGQYVSTVLDFVKAKGAKVPISIPRDLPPVGVTVGAENSSLRIDGFIPMTLIQNLFQAGMSAYMQFNRGQNPNGGGGGGL